jgi:hypothetical protein
MSRPSNHRSISSRLPYTASSRGFLRFLLVLILGSWICSRLHPRNGKPLGDRSFRAHESWQWTPTVDEEEGLEF